MTLTGVTWRGRRSRSSRAAMGAKHSGHGAVRVKLSPPCVTCMTLTMKHLGAPLLLGLASPLVTLTIMPGTWRGDFKAFHERQWLHFVRCNHAEGITDVAVHIYGAHQVLYDGRKREYMTCISNDRPECGQVLATLSWEIVVPLFRYEKTKTLMSANAT